MPQRPPGPAKLPHAPTSDPGGFPSHPGRQCWRGCGLPTCLIGDGRGYAPSPKVSTSISFQVQDGREEGGARFLLAGHSGGPEGDRDLGPGWRAPGRWGATWGEGGTLSPACFPSLSRSAPSPQARAQSEAREVRSVKLRQAGVSKGNWHQSSQRSRLPSHPQKIQPWDLQSTFSGASASVEVSRELPWRQLAVGTQDFSLVLSVFCIRQPQKSLWTETLQLELVNITDLVSV